MRGNRSFLLSFHSFSSSQPLWSRRLWKGSLLNTKEIPRNFPRRMQTKSTLVTHLSWQNSHRLRAGKNPQIGIYLSTCSVYRGNRAIRLTTGLNRNRSWYSFSEIGYFLLSGKTKDPVITAEGWQISKFQISNSSLFIMHGCSFPCSIQVQMCIIKVITNYPSLTFCSNKAS